jgi:hypothetical protein
MKRRIYYFNFTGTAAQGQTWEAMGTVWDNNNDLPAAFNEAMRQAFMDLTRGRAIYGKPGLGCNGPYEIDRIVMIKQPEKTI